MNIRVAIIEDEPATARHLRHLLQEIEPGIEVLATLNSVATATAWLQASKGAYQLLFMDIRLTDGTSFDIFERVAIDTPVIFVTAYDEYALKAFKANGIDYVLKPFDEAELAGALHKYTAHYQQTAAPAAPELQQVLQYLKAQSGFKKSFLVHFRDKLIPLQVTDVQWFYTQNETVQAATISGQLYTIDDTLEKLQTVLDPALFFRANRQFIINRDAVQEISFYFTGRLLVRVNPTPKENILISKARVADFKDWMNR